MLLVLRGEGGRVVGDGVDGFSSLGGRGLGVSYVVSGVFVGRFVVFVPRSCGVFVPVVGRRGVAVDGGLEVLVLVGPDGRVEEPVPGLLCKYQKRLIARCIINLYYNTATTTTHPTPIQYQHQTNQ